MTQKPIMWTLYEALVLVRSIQPTCHSLLYHVTLGGGVLNQDYSCKDLDLYFLPFGDTEQPAKTFELNVFLQSVLGEEFPLGGGFGTEGAMDYPKQEHTFPHRFTYRTSDNKRIDVLIA